MSNANSFEGFLTLPNLNDAVEPELIPAGDYTAEIIKAEVVNSKAGDPMLHVVLEIHDTGLENPNHVHERILLPNAGDDKDAVNNKLLRIKRWATCFGVEQESNGSIDLPRTEGLIGSVTLSIRPAKDDFPESNSVSRYHELRK